MKYVDMHCDTLTVSFDKGESLAENSLQTSLEKLNKSGCAAQCFAIFTQGEDAALCFEKYLSFFFSEIQKHGATRILCSKDLQSCIASGKTGAILTVENLGFTGGDISKLSALKDYGVKMASLVWNYENAYARPNLKFDGGIPLFDKREKRGLTPTGRQAVEILDSMKIIVDISHLSDGGALEILEKRKIPVVASHSNASAVCGVCRNLTDELIRKISDCGGAIGINYCKDFVGDGDFFATLLSHVKHIIKVGGEDVIALGSDFDGIPAPPEMDTCLKVPSLLRFFEENLGFRVTRKLSYENFARVFYDVCG